MDEADAKGQAGRVAPRTEGRVAVAAPERKATAFRPLIPATPAGAPTTTTASPPVPVVIGGPVAPGAVPGRPALGPACATVGTVPRVPVVAQTARKAAAVTGADVPAASAGPPETVLEVTKGRPAAAEARAAIRVRALASAVRSSVPETAVGVAVPTEPVLTPAALGGPG